MIKQLITLAIISLSAVRNYGQTAGQMSYQAVIRDNTGHVVVSTPVGMQISILQGSAAGVVVYEETQTPSTNAYGLLTVAIGDGIVESGNLAAIDWSAGPYFIKTETDLSGGTSYSITATNQVLSVPYALRAQIADSANTTLNAAYHAGNTVITDNGALTIAGTEGLMVEGTYNSGDTIPAIADNTPVMYFNPRKAAFRAGIVSSGKWDEAHVGYYSVALGYNAAASGNYATALGEVTTASGDAATAAGYGSIASGNSSTAIGNSIIASGNYSTAMGTHVSTNDHPGSFIFGDNSSTTLYCDADNQFMARFSGGYRFYTNSGATVGAKLNPGGNSWLTVSDSTRKENFLPVDEKDFLTKISRMKLTSWNYKGQDPKIFRHYGPMAQDFFAAFGKDKLGVIGDDTTINQADMMAVNLIAIQGLIRENDSLKAAVAQQSAIIKKLQAAIARSGSKFDEDSSPIKNLQEQIDALAKEMKAEKAIDATAQTSFAGR